MVEGELLLGRFTVGGRIGSGGYGTVHRAWDERLCRHVAIKAIEGPAAGRVMREAHAAARLNHTGIVTLYELGEQGGITYLVTELVAGPNLRQLAATGELSDRELAEIGAELCAALAHAHGQGVIHRDIKPDNVLVRGGVRKRTRAVADRAMLADFGIADVTDAPTLTATGQVVGTLAYMAPEQAAGEQPTPAVDVYALGLMLYEIWTGSNPVARANPASTARAIGEPLPPLGELRPELPPRLCEVIDAALAPNPALRPTVDELAGVLEATAGALHPERAVPEPEAPAALTTLPDELPRRPFAVMLAAGGVAGLGLLAGYPGLALLVAALLAPAALLLDSPRDWLRPGIAPLLGLVGAGPAYLVLAAARESPRERVALAALGWAWTVVATALLGRTLGVQAPTDVGAWAGSGRVAAADVLAPLASAEAIAIGLLWVGFAVLLGAVLDTSDRAIGAIGTLLWAAALVAALGLVGGPAAPTAALTIALVAGLGLLFWDRLGRPELGWERLAGRMQQHLVGPGPGSDPGSSGRGRGRRTSARSVPTPLRTPDERARRAAGRHLQAALHPHPRHSPPQRRLGRRKRIRIRASA